MTYRKRKSIRAAILALATAAILVPAAQAYPSFAPHTLSQSQGYTPQALKAMGERYTKMAEAYQATRPDDRGGVKGIGQTTVTSDYVDRQVANSQLALKQPPVRYSTGAYGAPGAVGTGPSTSLQAKSSPVTHVDDRAGVRGPGPVETPALVSTHDGFDWTDAGIGGAAMLFVAALIAAALLSRRRPSVAV
jgi:hypothetical protein